MPVPDATTVSNQDSALQAMVEAVYQFAEGQLNSGAFLELCSERLGDADSRLRVAQQAAEDAAAELEIQIEERRRTEEALHEANAKLTAWVYELEQRGRDTAVLREVSDLIEACIATEEAYAVIAEYVPRLFPETSGAVGILDQAGKLVETVASWENPGDGDAVFMPEHCWALRRGRSHWRQEASAGLRCTHLANGFEGSYGCIPLMAYGRPIGLLHLNNRGSKRDSSVDLNVSEMEGDSPPKALSSYVQQLAETVAEQLGMALANLQLREALRLQAIRDPLTGLFNRRHMEESLARELRRAARSGTSLGCMMIDIDHFKAFNDTWGHAAGDMALCEVATFLTSQVRSSDIVCRYGGEEFTLILPDATVEFTIQRAEQICDAASHLRLKRQSSGQPGITLSIGVSSFPRHGADGASILRVADMALYRAKTEGRNRVCAGGDP